MAEDDNPESIVCEVCGYVARRTQGTKCSRNGCDIGRHLWCAPAAELDKVRFSCTSCRESELQESTGEVKRSGRDPVQHPDQDLQKEAISPAAENHGEKGFDSRQPSAASAANPAQGSLEGHRVSSDMGKPRPEDGTQKPSTASGISATQKAAALAGLKRAQNGQPAGARPAVKPRLEASAPGAKSSGQDLLAASLSGLKKESERHKASRAEVAHGPGGVESESRSEQRLRQQAIKAHSRVPNSVLLERQKAAVAASVKEKPLWKGELIVTNSSEEEDPVSISLSGYGIAGNAHAMDAAVKLPRGNLRGSVLNCWETLEMNPLEAADNAAMVFQGSSPEDSIALSRLLEGLATPQASLVQVLLGEDKPLWVALLPGPEGSALAVFVRFAVKWTHSEQQPGPGLLKKEGGPKRRSLKWPDHSKSSYRSVACERGPGPTYTPAHVFTVSESPAPTAAPTDPRLNPKAPPPPPAGPLADMSVAIIGFQRDHDAIKNLRRSLKEAGAQTFTHNAPWPGCVNVLVFPEQMVDQGLGLETLAPKEMPPAKEFLLAKGTRFFVKIDYPLACCQLRRRLTAEEEVKWKIKELWPQGIQLTADAETLHDAATMRPQPEAPTYLEQVFGELAAAAEAAKPPFVWMLSIAPDHMKQLQARESPAHPLCLQHMKSKRCGVLDPGLSHPDVAVTATRVAHFFRWYGRHTILLVRQQDTGLRKNAEGKRTIHVASLEEAVPFMRSLRT